MSNLSNTVSVSVCGGSGTIAVPWVFGMNAQQAIEAAWNEINSTSDFTYALQYFGSQFGYLVVMINETYESFSSSSEPFFFWEFYVNGTAAQAGIDSTILNAGDAVSFALEQYSAKTHAKSTLRIKHEARLRGFN